MEAVYFPSSSSLNRLFEFVNRLNEYHSGGEVCVDFSSMGRIEPFVLLYAGYHISVLAGRNEEVFFRGHDGDNCSYASTMGFFKSFRLQHGKMPGEAPGNKNYKPVRILSVERAEERARQKYQVIQEYVDRESIELASVLARSREGNLADSLSYSIREIIRNVFEHGGAKQYGYSAQYWPAYGKVEVSIVDNGVGVYESLKENPRVEVNNYSDALQQALMPAVSSKNYLGALVDKDDPWHNSGFGLYMVSRLCRAGGEFLICSGDHAIRLVGDEKQHFDIGHFHGGVAVKMVINTDTLSNLAESLEKFREEGYKVAKNIDGVGCYEASAASQMLSRDFR